MWDQKKFFPTARATIWFCMLLGVAFQISSVAAARNRSPCEENMAKLARKKTGGKLDPLSDNENDLERIRKKVAKKLGWIPDEKWIDLTDSGKISDIKLFKTGAKKQTKDTMIAFTSFRLAGTRLEMSLTEVNEKFRQNGLSEFMLAKILDRYPQVTEIHIGDMDGSNWEVFQKAFKKMGCKKALKQTYAYLRYSALGFTKMVDPICRFATFTEMDFGNGKKYRMGNVESEFSFTVKRPKKNDDGE